MSVFNRAPHSESTSITDLPPAAADPSSCGAPTSAAHAPPSPSPPPSAAAAAAVLNRLVVRDLPYHQSSNSLRIRHQSTKPLRFYHWYVEDWFHVLLRLRTVVSVFVFVLLWTTFLLLFAGIYHAIDGADPRVNCGLGIPPNTVTFYTACEYSVTNRLPELESHAILTNNTRHIYYIFSVAFSLETTTTVGYGLPNGTNGFFDNCPGLQVAIYFQMLISMFLNAFLLSFVFARLSRCESRAAQVLFSNKAILNREILPNGITVYNLSVQTFDADSKYPIVEAHVRFYAVRHGRMHSKSHQNLRHPMNMEPMRISMPNDDLGAVLYTSIPTKAVHHIDYQSPLNPPSKRKLGPEDGRVDDPNFVTNPCGLNLRENDSYTGGQDGLRCAICGETYGTVANLIQHIRYSQHLERHDDVPVKGSHQELDLDALFRHKAPGRSPRPARQKLDREEGVGIDVDNGDKSNNEQGGSSQQNKQGAGEPADIEKPSEATAPWYEEYRAYLKEANIEIICVVEAIDPIMSGTFQAIQSYTLDDIVFDAEFAPCVLADVGSGPKDIGWLSRWFVGRSAVGRSVKVDLDSFHKVEQRR